MSVYVSHFEFNSVASLVNVSHVEFNPVSVTNDVRVSWVQFDPRAFIPTPAVQRGGAGGGIGFRYSYPHDEYPNIEYLRSERESNDIMLILGIMMQEGLL